MEEEIERMVVDVRADTEAFRRDVAEMRGVLEGSLAVGAARAGQALESALARAVRSGKFGFEDLKRVALGAMAEIASSAIRGGIGAAIGTGGGVAGTLGGLVTTLLGLPGRATGGLVGPGRAYRVGERGPETFVPISSGRIEPGGLAASRDVRLNITINAPAGSERRALERSSRQVARAVRSALTRAE